MITIGVLALQGDTRFHEDALDASFSELKIDGKVKKVKNIKDLEGIDGLVIPGGESTVIGVLAKRAGLQDAIKNKIIGGLPTLGTCAGLVFLARMVYDKTVGKVNQTILGVLDVDIERNSFGTQRESFEADLNVSVIGENPYRGIFIRAPVIKNVGTSVEVLAKFNNEIVAVKQDNVIGVAFHPELSNDLRLFKYFLGMIKN